MSDRAPGEVVDGNEEAEAQDDLDIDLDAEDAEGSEGADGEAAEGDDADPEAEAGGDVEPEPRRRGGGAETPRNLRRRAQEAERALAAEKAERAALDVRLRSLEQRQAVDPAAQARAAAERAERRRMMSPDELAADVTQEIEQRFNGAFQTLQFQHGDQLDLQRYESAAARSKVRADYQPRVEALLASERARGNNPTRDAIFKYLLGEDTEARAARAAPAQRKAAGARVAAQTTRPGGARGAAVPGRRAPAGSYESDRALIDGKPLW